MLSMRAYPIFGKAIFGLLFIGVLIGEVSRLIIGDLLASSFKPVVGFELIVVVLPRSMFVKPALMPLSTFFLTIRPPKMPLVLAFSSVRLASFSTLSVFDCFKAWNKDDCLALGSLFERFSKESVAARVPYELSSCREFSSPSSFSLLFRSRSCLRWISSILASLCLRTESVPYFSASP